MKPPIKNKEMPIEKDIFERLKSGKTIPQGDSQRNRMRDVSYESKKY